MVLNEKNAKQKYFHKWSQTFGSLSLCLSHVSFVSYGRACFDLELSLPFLSVSQAPAGLKRVCSFSSQSQGIPVKISVWPGKGLSLF